MSFIPSIIPVRQELTVTSNPTTKSDCRFINSAVDVFTLKENQSAGDNSILKKIKQLDSKGCALLLVKEGERYFEVWDHTAHFSENDSTLSKQSTLPPLHCWNQYRGTFDQLDMQGDYRRYFIFSQSPDLLIQMSLSDKKEIYESIKNIFNEKINGPAIVDKTMYKDWSHYYTQKVQLIDQNVSIPLAEPVVFSKLFTSIELPLEEIFRDKIQEYEKKGLAYPIVVAKEGDNTPFACDAYSFFYHYDEVLQPRSVSLDTKPVTLKGEKAAWVHSSEKKSLQVALLFPNKKTPISSYALHLWNKTDKKFETTSFLNRPIPVASVSLDEKNLVRSQTPRELFQLTDTQQGEIFRDLLTYFEVKRDIDAEISSFWQEHYTERLKKVSFSPSLSFIPPPPVRKS